MDGIARLQVASENPTIARLVRKVELDIESYSPDSQSNPRESEKQILKRKHKSIMEMFAGRYICLPTSTQDGDEEPPLRMPCPHIYHNEDYVPNLSLADRPSDGTTRCFRKNIATERPRISIAISACIARLPNLQAICINEGGFKYLWTFPTELSIDYQNHTQVADLERSRPARWIIKDLALCEKVESVQFHVSLKRLAMGKRSSLINEVIERSLPKLKQLSLIFSNDSDEGPIRGYHAKKHVIEACSSMAFATLSY